jgi:alkylhydroperoxidase/carboxymuconolactone decarboxylase family protein YurZ
MPRNQADYDRGVALRKKLRGNLPLAAGPAAMEELAPDMAELVTEVLFGRVWTRPQLDLKLRSVATLATLIALPCLFAVIMSRAGRGSSSLLEPESA